LNLRLGVSALKNESAFDPMTVRRYEERDEKREENDWPPEDTKRAMGCTYTDLAGLE
jgi:hypothetical protein